MMKFDYRKICQDLLKNLSQRTSNIIEGRFGLKTGKKETLEAIGQGYGLTRERVRQIIEEGFLKIRPKIKEHQKISQYFNGTLKSFGDLKKEDVFLNFLGGQTLQNQVFFLLTLNKNFERISEDKDFFAFWTKRKESIDLAKKVVDSTLNRLESEKKTFPLEKIYEVQKVDLERILGKKINKNIFSSYLELSKKIQKNPENQFGLRNWLEINPRGIKDKAYLVLKKEGRPLHFSQVAVYIDKLPFSPQRKAQLATVHNELIRDQRFVLVGRGLYALREWGYEPGVVKDIIFKTLKEANRPLSKKEIIDRVLKQRVVKENTILLNLQDRNKFLRDSEGRYKISAVQEA